MKQGRQEIQTKIINKLGLTGGTIIASPGMGKSFVMYGFFNNLLKNSILKPNDEVLILSQTKVQGENLEKERKKYEKLFEKLKLKLYFKCHASQEQLEKYKCVVVDEFDCMVTKIYYKTLLFYKNLKIPFLCMSGTVRLDGNPFIDDLDFTVRQSDENTKAGKVTKDISYAQLMEICCPPIVYEYTYDEAVKDGLVKEVETYVIPHKLGTNKIYFSKKVGLLPEKLWFQYNDKMRKNYGINKFYRMNLSKVIMPKLIWNLPSKVDRIKNYIKHLDGQILLFGVELALLKQITENVIENSNSSTFTFDKNGYFTYSKTGNKYKARDCLTWKSSSIEKESYDKAKAFWKKRLKDSKVLIKNFNFGKSNILASAKTIGRGVTLERIDHIVFCSYNSTFNSIFQKLARGIRLGGKEKCMLHFIVTTDCPFEMDWFNRLSVKRDDLGQVVETLNLNIKNEEFKRGK